VQWTIPSLWEGVRAAFNTMFQGWA